MTVEPSTQTHPALGPHTVMVWRALRFLEWFSDKPEDETDAESLFSDPPNVPAVYAMTGGCGRGLYVASMADLLALQPKIQIDLHIVALDSRREKVFQEPLRSVFSLLEGGPRSMNPTPAD